MAVGGKAVSIFTSPSPLDTCHSVQPVEPMTRSPTAKPGWRLSTTSLMPLPRITIADCHRRDIVGDIFHPAFLRRIKAEIERPEQKLAIPRRTHVGFDELKVAIFDPAPARMSVQQPLARCRHQNSPHYLHRNCARAWPATTAKSASRLRCRGA
jgi:hypothetical protein